MHTPIRPRIPALVLLLMAAFGTLDASALTLEQQRKVFREALIKAQAGDTTVIKNYRGKLADYPLWPDVQAALYRARLGKESDKKVMAFVAEHPDKSFVHSLRYRLTKSLATRGKWKDVRTMVETYYADSDDPVIRCHYVRSKVRLEPGNASADMALDLWMNGESLPKECDAVFAGLKKAKLITVKRLRQRIDLALEQRNFKLATYLAKSAHRKDADRVSQWANMRRNPLDQLKKNKRIRNNKANRELLLYGLQRAARRDPKATRALWPALNERYSFSAAEENMIERGIALSAARDRLPDALIWLSKVREHNVDSGSWFVRRALASGNWPFVLHATNTLPAEIAEDTTWRYWRARALEAMGQPTDAAALYEQVASERSYYGFLAADRLGIPYNFEHEGIVADPAIQAEIKSDPRLIRARELFKTKLHGNGRSEWDRVINTFDTPFRQQAALLADEWGWHSRAINTMAKTPGVDLALSYPLPYEQQFIEATEQAGIERSWAYGITRSESLFMPDVRSSANAYGLMQLIPSTGKLTAKSAHITYRGRSTLLDPHTNIRLGTHYLGQVLSRFGNNQVLATAAYNAGPHRVKTWLPESTWQADIWVENIPFTETRRYVKKVLRSQAISHWRLTGKQQRLAGMMPPILNEPNSANRFASN